MPGLAAQVAGENSGQKQFRPDIEGLRAVAVLAVVLFHAEVPGLDGGYIGVDVFFVISGFLITGLLWREVRTSGTVGLRRFYGARARRLLPASAMVGVATMIASVVLLAPLQIPTVAADGIASALYVSNYWFIMQGVDYSAPFLPPSPFQQFWSLGVEEQFYLVWPALIILTAWGIRRLSRRKAVRAPTQRPYLLVLALVAAISFALSLAVCHWAPFVAFFSLPTRAWQLAVGGLIALTADQWRRLSPRIAALAGFGGVGSIILACNLFSPTTLYPGTAALLPTLGTALVIGAGCAIPTRGCGRLLSLAPMRAIGRISYSWYLWHWPILLLAPVALGQPLGLAARLAAALLSAGLAVLTWRFIESPLRFAPRIRESPRRSLLLGGAATAVAVAVCLAVALVVPKPVGAGSPAATLRITTMPASAASGISTADAAVQNAFTQVQAAVEASADLTAVPSNLEPPLAEAAAEDKATHLDGCLRLAFSRGKLPDCVAGDTASTTTVALVGDSHAAMWHPAFQTVAEERHWRLQFVGMAGCPVIDVPVTNPQLHREYSECDDWRSKAMAQLQESHPRLVVVSMWRGYGSGNFLSNTPAYGPAWLASLTRLVQQLRAGGAQVLVLGPIPDPQSVVPICLSSHLDDATACAPSRSTAVNQLGISREAAATEFGGGYYSDLTDLFCTDSRCPVIIGNTLVYFDWNHLTVEYSRTLAPVMAALADRAMAAA
ncbi:acyltransferase family protein [Mycobacterium sp. M26]|uniref:acyltransferase family protein n=1 Tax=Mycobacterium sp. M26 TaxID=1762962 RepID=UPI00073F66F0|nr:acyltransferase family protein [Mycobacterium sp. M26]